MRKTFRANFLTPITLIALSVLFLFTASYMYNVHLIHQQLRVGEPATHSILDPLHLRSFMNKGRSKQNKIIVISKAANTYNQDVVTRHLQNGQLSTFVNWIYGDKNTKTEYICLLGNPQVVYILPKDEKQPINASQVVKITMQGKKYTYARPYVGGGLNINDIGLNNLRWEPVASIGNEQLNDRYGNGADYRIRHQINLNFVDSDNPDDFIKPEYNTKIVNEKDAN